jgi:hypothetical protein
MNFYGSGCDSSIRFMPSAVDESNLPSSALPKC